MFNDFKAIEINETLINDKHIFIKKKNKLALLNVSTLYIITNVAQGSELSSQDAQENSTLEIVPTRARCSEAFTQCSNLKGNKNSHQTRDSIMIIIN